MMATPSVAKNAITSTSSHLSEACRSMPFCRAQLLLLSNEWREELTMLGPELGDGISAAIEVGSEGRFGRRRSRSRRRRSNLGDELRRVM